MKFDAVVAKSNDLEDILDELIVIYENPPEGVDINDFQEGDIEEGTLEAEPKTISLLFQMPENEIPQEIVVKKTFTPWYANEEYERKTHGYGCDVGVIITVTLIHTEQQDSGVIGEYQVTNIEETG